QSNGNSLPCQMCPVQRQRKLVPTSGVDTERGAGAGVESREGFWGLRISNRRTSVAPMLTDAEMQGQFASMMDRMLVARWLLCYTFTDGKGYHLTWTVLGAERAVRLKEIAEAFRLKGDDRAPLMFDQVAKGESLPHETSFSGDLDNATANFWCESVRQLG